MNLKTAYEDYNRFKETEDYDPEKEGTFSRRLAWFCRNLSGGEKVLDYGCGEGVVLNGLTARKNLSGDSCGVDLSVDAVKKAQARFPSLTFHPLDESGGIPFPGNHFDAIVATEVIEHVFDTDQVFSEFRRVLKPRGKLLLTCPYHGFLKDLTMLLTGKIEAHYRDPYSFHIRHYSFGSLEGVLRKHGFTILQMGGVGRAPFLWKSLTACAEKNS
ncbi:MAG: class I SAM-dependent methyltransferase [Candidatus Omnitrophota bacterium]|nr:class I SAM-dependent methyltransferase [Candidatus Omnitrophota bacterium]